MSLRVYVSAEHDSLTELLNFRLNRQQYPVGPAEHYRHHEFEALPLWGHHYVGRSVNVFQDVPGNLIRCIRNAEVVFVWLHSYDQKQLHFQGVEIGYAYALGIPVLLGHVHNSSIAHLQGLIRISGRYHNITEAYRSLMSDAEMLCREFWTQHYTELGGICSYCNGEIYKFEYPYSNRHGGMRHPDCHARAENIVPDSDTLFTSELVAALREENAVLQAKLRAPSC